MAHLAASTGDLPFWCCLTFLRPSWLMRAGTGLAPANPPCCSQKVSIAASPWLQMQRMHSGSAKANTSPSGRPTEWQAAFDVDITPPEGHLFRGGGGAGRSLSAKMPRYHIFASCNEILRGSGRSDYTGPLKECCFWNQILSGRVLTCLY